MDRPDMGGTGRGEPTRPVLNDRIARIATRISKVAAIAALAVTGALILGAFPVQDTRADTSTDEPSVAIHVISNGFHSDIVLPADGETLGRLGLAASHFPVEPGLVRGWAIGWGSRTAYTSLRAISDLSPAIVFKAITFDESVMHVAPLGPIEPGDGIWRIELTRERYDDLVAGIAHGFADGTRAPIAGITQGFGDRFYVGRGRFTAWFGCNAWVGRQLRKGGVPVGLWTPAAQSLAYGLDRIEGGSQP